MLLPCVIELMLSSRVQASLIRTKALTVRDEVGMNIRLLNLILSIYSKFSAHLPICQIYKQAKRLNR